MKKTSIRLKMLPRRIVVVVFLIAFIVIYDQSTAQLKEIVVPKPEVAIPPGSYKTWSLFLISNPEWVLPQASDKLKELFWQFKAFGGAIGPSHAAVWFSSGEPSENELYKTVDIERSVAFCQKLKLPPS